MKDKRTLGERIDAAMDECSACCMDDEDDRRRLKTALAKQLLPTGEAYVLLTEFRTGHPMPRNRMERLIELLGVPFPTGGDPSKIEK